MYGEFVYQPCNHLGCLQPKVGTMHFFVAQENVDYMACEINFFEERKKSILFPLHVIQEDNYNPTSQQNTINSLNS